MATHELRILMNQSYVQGLREFQSIVTRHAYELQSSNDRRYIIDVMSIVFGSDKNRGWLSQCADDITQNETEQSRARFELFLGILSTQGPFYKMLENFKSSRCNLEFQQLPFYLNSQLRELKASRRSSLMSSSVQQYCKIFAAGDQFFDIDRCNLTIMEWFFFMLVTQLKKFSFNKKPFLDYEAIILDDYYYDITRNPHLVLIRRYLEGFTSNRENDNKIKLAFLIKEYFVKDIFQIPFGKAPSKINGNACLEVVYLLIYYARNILQPQEMHKYFDLLLRSDRSSYISEGYLNDIIRIWLYYIRPADRIESQLIGTAVSSQKGKKQAKVYKVKRYNSQLLLDRYNDNLTQTFVREHLSIYVDMFHLIIKAFGSKLQMSYKDLYWLDCVVTYFIKSPPVAVNVSGYLSEESRVREFQGYAAKALYNCRTSISRFNTAKLNAQQLNETAADMQRFFETIKRGITQIYKIDKDNPIPKLPIYKQTPLERTYYPLITHTDVRGSPWLAPPADYEYTVAYYFWMAVAKILDILMIRGLNGYPKTNLRWLCSYTYTIVVLVLVFAASCWISWKK